MNTHFILFSNCIAVKGISRSSICDLQRKKFALIPNDLYDVILYIENHSIKETIKYFGNENKGNIIEYLEYIETEGFGFFCSSDERKNFPKIDTIFKQPSAISNFILELKQLDVKLLTLVVSQLDVLKCEALQIYFQCSLTLKDHASINKILKNSVLKSVEVTACYSDDTEKYLSSLDNMPNKLLQLTLYNSNEESISEYGKPFLFKFIKTKKIINCNACGTVSLDYMAVNKEKFLESLHFNSCLYKKMSIDLNGNIKNCPSMAKSFGNIRNITLNKALNQDGFKDYWNIKKDKIEGCKDCEFRHVCTDCRAYLEDPNNNYSKPLKCGYDPQSNTWSDWSKNPLKKEICNHYGFKE